MKNKPCNRVNMIFAIVLLPIIILASSSLFGQCPEAPRKIEYSSNFYKAQSYFMEQNNSKSAKLNVIIKGVPLGGEASATNWSTQNSNLTEDQAINYIKSELSDYRTQIVAEVSSVICQISNVPNPTPIQLRAIDAIEKIASIALGYSDGISSSINRNGNFILLPSNPFIFFKEGATTNQTLLLTVVNTTAGSLNLILDQPDQLPVDFPWYIKYAKSNPEITLKPKETRQLPFYINYPKDQTVPYQATINLKSKNDHSINAISTVNIFPTNDFFQLPPEIINGEIKTNANIKCSANDHSDFTAEHSNWFPLPYNGGPNMGYAGQTSCFAITEAYTSTGTNTKSKYSWTLDVTNKCGGVCGPNNVGGDGNVTPEYKTTIKLPTSSKNTTWTLNFRGRGTQGNGSTTVYLTGNGEDKSFTFDRSGNPQRLTITNLKAGEYKLEVRMPKLERGCYGAYPGTNATTIFNTIIDVEILRVDANH